MKQISNEKYTLLEKLKRRYTDHPFWGRIIFIAVIIIGLSSVIGAGTYLVRIAGQISFRDEGLNCIDNAIDAAISKHPKEKERLSVIRLLYEDLMRENFSAQKYYAPLVERYYNVRNYTPTMIDSIFAINKLNFADPRSKIIESTFTISRDKRGYFVIVFSSDFSCFRNDKGKYQSGRVSTEIIFDANNRIISLYDKKVEDPDYTDERIE